MCTEWWNDKKTTLFEFQLFNLINTKQENINRCSIPNNSKAMQVYMQV